MISLLVLLAVAIALLCYFGVRRERTQAKRLSGKLLSTPAAMGAVPLVPDTSSNLPKPVERYFRLVLPRKPKRIRIVRLQQKGDLRINPSTTRWSPFGALYLATEDPEGFVWDASVAVLPLIHLRVRDAFVGGIGSGNVSLMSAIPLGGERGTPELNSGALYRYLAESVWHPTALLPRSGLEWEAVDENRAIAHLESFGMIASLEFRFNAIGEITGIYTEDRLGRFDGRYIKYPWEGCFGEYREIDGVRIPMTGKVGWHLPEGWWLFWRGRIVSAVFTHDNKV